MTSQLYLSDYLDSGEFRPFVQISDQDVRDFYEKAVVPRAKERGQAPPSLERAHDTIQEALTQQAIDNQADVWLKESRDRLHIDKLLGDNGKE